MTCCSAAMLGCAASRGLVVLSRRVHLQPRRDLAQQRIDETVAPGARERAREEQQAAPVDSALKGQVDCVRIELRHHDRDATRGERVVQSAGRGRIATRNQAEAGARLLVVREVGHLEEGRRVVHAAIGILRKQLVEGEGVDGRGQCRGPVQLLVESEDQIALAALCCLGGLALALHVPVEHELDRPWWHAF
eukprot:scaffold79671_cov36-Phaeocystis_antarctica.AAC.2